MKNKLTLYVFTLMNFVIMMTASLFNGILDKVAIDLNVTVALSGLLNSAYAFGAAIGVPIILILFFNVNRKHMIISLLSLTFVSIVGLIYAPNFIILLIFRTLMGVVANGYGVLAMSTVIAMSETGKQGRALAFLLTGNALALVIGIPLTRVLYTILDWRSIFWILNTTILLVIIYFQFNLPLYAKKSEDSHIMQELKYLKDPKVLLILLYTFSMFVGYSALYTYVTPYIIYHFPSVESWMSILLIVIGIAAFTGNQIGGYISDKLGYKKSMLIGALLQLICVILIILTKPWIWLNILTIVIWVMFAWMTGLQLNLGIMQETSHDANFIISLNGSSIQFSSAIGTSIAAIIITQFGLSQLVFITLITISFSLLVQTFSIRRK
ncbi:MAG TPA: MFS transporter [Erysipelotrichaceae bacterium]|nr:MFS transporter [Erysipelotrichaceae bacterium]